MPTLCDHVDSSPPESSVHGIPQAKCVELPALILLLQKDRQKSGLWHREEQPEKSSTPWVQTSRGLHLLKLQLWPCVIFTNRDEWNFEILTDALFFSWYPKLSPPFPQLRQQRVCICACPYVCECVCVCVCVCARARACILIPSE